MTVRESIEQSKRRVVDWDSIQWDTPRRHVRRIQERIFRATRDKDWAKVKNLQKLLIRSHSARLLVRRVTQENKGKYTPGIDGQIYATSKYEVSERCQSDNLGMKLRRHEQESLRRQPRAGNFIRGVPKRGRG